MAPFPSHNRTWHISSYPSISPTRPELYLVGKSAVITGGGSGTGLAISKALSQAGISQLAIIGRRADFLSSAAATIHDLVGEKTKVLTISADVANKEQVDEAFLRIHEDFGEPLDILISNAAQLNGQKALGTEGSDEWTRSLDINIKGVYFVSAAFVVNAASNATIINVSAIVHLPAMPGFYSYAATKAAGTKTMQYVQADNPLMHVVDMHPGQVRETYMAQKTVKSGVLAADHIDDGESEIDNRQLLMPWVIVDLSGDFAVWLASSEAKFLKGKFVLCNWDVNELKANSKDIESSALLTIELNGEDSFQF